MMQLDRLPLGDKGMTDRILDQHILHRLIVRAGCLLAALAERGLAASGQQPVKNVDQKANDN